MLLEMSVVDQIEGGLAGSGHFVVALDLSSSIVLDG